MYEFILLIKLVCAHFCSDFIFQTNKVHEGKCQNGIKGLSFQIFHSLIHAATAYLFIAQWNNWQVPTILFITHFLIDYVKYKFKKSGLSLFIVDQAAHLTVIFIMWYLLFCNYTILCNWYASINSVKLWIIVTAYILVLKPSSVLLGLFIKQWISNSNTQSLPKAGQWIGFLERILILTFILIGCIEGVGFLLAAKSVFRFGALNNSKEIKTTEYVLIGTMSSFALAILVGVATKLLL